MARILFIGDEVAIRQEIAERLTAAGHTMFQAGDGLEGLDVAVESKPELILCDITLPGMDGRELLVELRARHPEFNDVPAIFVSALCDHKDMIEAVKLGTDDYITKPIEFEILKVKVASALRHVARTHRQKEDQPAVVDA